MHFQPMPVGLEPCPDIGVLGVGGVVLNQNRSLTAVSPSELFQEAKVGSGMEDMVPAIVEACAPKFDGTENLDVLAFSRHRDFRWASDATPGGVDGGVLPETGFVGKDERPLSRAGFLRVDRPTKTEEVFR